MLMTWKNRLQVEEVARQLLVLGLSDVHSISFVDHGTAPLGGIEREVREPR